jgi:hypothetical protein
LDGAGSRPGRTEDQIALSVFLIPFSVFIGVLRFHAIP